MKSRRNKNLAQFDINAKNKLSTEQETVIKAATEALTKEQWEHCWDMRVIDPLFPHIPFIILFDTLIIYIT